MVQPPADVVGEHRIADRLRPIEQEIVVIEDVVLLLGLDIGREQFPQLFFPAAHQGKLLRSTSSSGASEFTARE